MYNNLSLIILSCNKFSDLWDGLIKLLEKNWPNRGIATYIVTDAPTSKKYPNIKIIATGIEKEWSDRLVYALSQIQTDYVFITLDDYFLIKPVQNQRIKTLLQMMEQEKLDYVRLFIHPKTATGDPLLCYAGIYRVDITKIYSVNLYPGLWHKKFLEYTTSVSLNAWRFEVSLAKSACQYQARCVMSKQADFVILDVVRKGQLLRRAVRYFRKHPGIYKGNRSIRSWWQEGTLGIQTLASRYLPNRGRKIIKGILHKFGKQFYSDEAE